MTDKIQTLRSLFNDYSSANNGAVDYKNTDNRDTGFIILSEENRRYLTGFPSSDGILAVGRDDAVFFTDSRYIEAAKQTVKACRCEELTDAYAQLKSFFGSEGLTAAETESNRVTVSRFNALQKKLDGITVLSTGRLDSCLDAMRSVKTDDEISLITDAQRIAEAAFSHILEFIKPGVTEKQIALELDYYMLSHGAEALSFDTIAISGANTSKPHGVPCEKKVEYGDFVTMDFGAVTGGMHSDMTRTVAVGKAGQKQREIYALVLEAKNAAEAIMADGVLASDADRAARSVIEKAGYGDFFRHSTGHGVGIEIHEFPNVSPRSNYTLKSGNVVTAEPGIYIPSEFGVRVEDMVVIRENGCDIITKAPEELIVL